MKKLRIITIKIFLPLIFFLTTVQADVVHHPDFSVNYGGYSVEGTGLSLATDSIIKPLSSPSLKITATDASGIVKSSSFTITATHKNGWVSGSNLAYWKVQFYVKTSEDFSGTYRIVARILDDKNYTHPSDPRYDQTGEPFEIPFDNYGGSDSVVNGFIYKNKPICAICTTHSNNRNTYGNNDVEFTIYLGGANGILWLSDVNIETAVPHTGPFSASNWNQFETSDGVHYLTFGSVGQPEYAPTEDFCSELIVDTAYKLFRAVGFNQCRTPVQWHDHLSRSEYNIIIYNSQPDGSGDYEQSLDILEELVDRLAYYGISTMLITRGTPDWSHPLHYNNTSDGPHNGFLNPGNLNGLGNPYFGPYTMVGDHWTYPPDVWQDWRDYVAALVTRMQGKDVFYEIFNEINVSGQANLVGGYKAATKFTQHFAEVAYSIEPNTVIITGAMDKMLAGCVADGIMNYANAAGYHGYSGDLLGTRGITQSCGQMKHIWMTEHHGVHEELWSTTRGQGNWNSFSVSAWTIKDQYKILVLVDSVGNWINASMPAGLGDRVEPVQDYYSYGVISGTLDFADPSGQNPGRITAQVICDEVVQYGTSLSVILRATNNSSQTFHNVKLWPVGFVDNLGVDMATIRALDMTVAEFAPGQVCEIPLTIRPTTTEYKAAGIYHIGLVVVNDEGKHSLAWEPLEVVPFGTFCATMLPGDLNFDCKVDFDDLQILFMDWLTCD